MNLVGIGMNSGRGHISCVIDVGVYGQRFLYRDRVFEGYCRIDL